MLSKNALPIGIYLVLALTVPLSSSAQESPSELSSESSESSDSFTDGTDNGSSEDSSPEAAIPEAAPIAPPSGLLAAMNLEKLDLTGADLYNLNLMGSNLKAEQLSKANSIELVKLNNINLTGLNITGISVKGSNFMGVQGISGLEISAAGDLTDTNLSGLDFAGVSFSGMNLSGVRLTDAKNLDGSSLNGVLEINEAVLENLDLSNWSVVPMSGTVRSFAGSKLNEYVLESPIASGASLAGVDISFWQPTSMTGINLVGAVNFTGANIQGNIYSCEMGRTNMEGYDFQGKTITGNFSGVFGMTGENLNDLEGVVIEGGTPINLANRDLTGWNPRYSINGAWLVGVKGITAMNLINSADIRYINLAGSGITKGQLDAALEQVGKKPTGYHDTSLISY